MWPEGHSDAEVGSHFHYNSLRGNTAGPEYRDFPFSNYYRVSKVRFIEVFNANF
jgi:hypothetical protein